MNLEAISKTVFLCGTLRLQLCGTLRQKEFSNAEVPQSADAEVPQSFQSKAIFETACRCIFISFHFVIRYQMEFRFQLQSAQRPLN